MERDSFENRAASLFGTLPSSSAPSIDKKEKISLAPPPAWVVSGVCQLPDRGPDPEQDPEELQRECESPDSAISEDEGGADRRAALQHAGDDEDDEDEDDAPVVVEPQQRQQQQKRGERGRPARQCYVPPGRSSLKPSGGGGGGDGKERQQSSVQGGGHKRIRFSDDTSSRSRGGDSPNQAGTTEGSRSGHGKPCFSFSQTGKCKFGERCRFTHTLPDHVANPSKYQRYEVNWDDEESGGGANKAAAMATLELARKNREAEEAVDPAEERAAFERDRLEREQRMEAKKRKLADAEANGGAGGKKKAKRGPQLSFADEEAE